VVVWILAAAIRLGVFGLAENKQGDAPMRVLIAERMNAEPAAARDARSFCQFGPLPIEVIRPFLWLDPGDARRASRWPSLLAGLAVFPWLAALGRRLWTSHPLGAAHGPRDQAQTAEWLAALALALAPLHVQASTTASSEALYLLLSVGAYERLAAALGTRRWRDFAAAGGLASLVAVTRFDAWIGLPVAGAACAWRWRWRSVRGARDARALGEAALFLGVAAVLPAVYLAWNWRDSGDPFFFARYIARDHAELAAAVTARLGGGGARARQLGIWLAAFTAIMSPALVVAGARALAGWRRLGGPAQVVLVSALAPTALYLVKGLALGDFEPLPRFAIAPGALLLCSAALRLLADRGARRAAVEIALGALATSAVALLLGFGPALREAGRHPQDGQSGRVAAPVASAPPGRIWGGAESVGPLTRLDAEDRALAEFLRARRRPEEVVFVDTFGYVDIAIAHAAGVPLGRVATLTTTRTPSETLAATRTRTGATWFAYHVRSWAGRLPPDWPEEAAQLGQIRAEAPWSSTRIIGGWRIVHAGAAEAAGALLGPALSPAAHAP
jgi:hypothetical protein